MSPTGVVPGHAPRETAIHGPGGGNGGKNERPTFFRRAPDTTPNVREVGQAFNANSPDWRGGPISSN